MEQAGGEKHFPVQIPRWELVLDDGNTIQVHPERMVQHFGWELVSGVLENLFGGGARGNWGYALGRGSIHGGDSFVDIPGHFNESIL